MSRSKSIAEQHSAIGGASTKLYAPMGRKRLKEIRAEVPVIRPGPGQVRNLHGLQRKKTIIRLKQQEEAGSPVETFYELIQKSTGRVITRRAMNDQEAARKNRLGPPGAYWRRVGY